MSGAGRFFNAMKGGQRMACNHERIQSVNCVISCVLCGKILPSDYLTNKKTPAQEEAVKQPAEAQETDETKVYAPKKRTAKKGGK